MNRFCYTLLLKAVAPIAFKLLERKAKRAGGVWEIRAPARFGRYEGEMRAQSALPTLEAAVEGRPEAFDFARPVWVHAVSLGETRAAQPLIQALLDQGLAVLLTHMTATGRTMGASFFESYIRSGQLRQVWIPYDLPAAVKGFLDHWQPRCGILIEREIWPNLLAEAKAQQIPMVVVSARFSVSALKQARRMGKVLREAFTSLALILAQTVEDQKRLQDFGLERVYLGGNLKFDVQVAAPLVKQARQLKQQLRRAVVVIASTRDGEEAMFLEALKKEAALPSPGVSAAAPLYVLVPRHPQRFGEVAQLFDSSGLNYCRRSEEPDSQALSHCQVLLGDSVGEMFFYYGLADVAIIGGSFADFGGQNNIEASALGVPVIVGSHTANFKQAVADAIAVGAALRCTSAAEAIGVARQLLADPRRGQAMRQAAEQWMAQHRGATERTMQYLQPFLK
ncbi:3-deoxy-D-manno-octulosonic acid transferase [Oligella sp. MSHR50489EDL]|uniref:3-deoxy-D-manno-octulosonic acid transferase n=1 Tax=Oligella sp. MSHR50489EDL TaxID=3139409 RepID=UPI003D8185F0